MSCHPPPPPQTCLQWKCCGHTREAGRELVLCVSLSGQRELSSLAALQTWVTAPAGREEKRRHHRKCGFSNYLSPSALPERSSLCVQQRSWWLMTTLQTSCWMHITVFMDPDRMFEKVFIRVRLQLWALKGMNVTHEILHQSPVMLCMIGGALCISLETVWTQTAMFSNLWPVVSPWMASRRSFPWPAVIPFHPVCSSQPTASCSELG